MSCWYSIWQLQTLQVLAIFEFPAPTSNKTCINLPADMSFNFLQKIQHNNFMILFHFASISGCYCECHVGTICGNFKHYKFWPYLNFLLQHQTKLVLICLQIRALIFYKKIQQSPVKKKLHSGNFEAENFKA